MKVRGSYVVKTLALLFCILTFAAFVVLVLGVAFTAQSGLYTSSLQSVKEQTAASYLDSCNLSVASCFTSDSDGEQNLRLQDLINSYEHKNYEFALYGTDGALLADTRRSGAVFAEDEQAFLVSVSPDGEGHYLMRVPLSSGEEGVIRVCGQIPAALSQEDELLTAFRFLENIADKYKYTMPVLLLCAFVLYILLFTFLMVSAGYRRDAKVPRCNWVDKIPFDIYLLFFAVLVTVQLALLFGTEVDSRTAFFLLAVALVVNQPLALAFCISFATRAKTGTLWRNTLIARLFLLIFRAIRAIPVVPKTVIGLSVLFLWSVAVMVSGFYDGQLAVILFTVGWAVVAVGAVAVAVSLKKLKTGAERIAGGDLQFQISTDLLTGDLKRHAETLNHIGQGLSREVEQRLKSERFKTELITNVSHDLKTPLTSIVNYVDLLGKEPIESETVRGYVQVLDRQARRLKKLTEDLVEASKAQTGNLRVDAVPCELGELFSQAVGEYQEKLDEAQLTAVTTVPETPVKILADGRYLWRIFDNLLNNICKYSQSNTRVYLNLKELDGNAYVIFRNTSRYPLTASGEELTERFVRGDPSRHTEGSGLGLSIARSLVELQKGKMDVTVDGDLFKVTLTFRTIS